MYNIVICDDDRKFIDYMKQIVIKAAENPNDLKFEEYESGEDLVRQLDVKNRIDLLILDMEMKKLDGDETAMRFREIHKDAVLVFCSGVRFPTVKSFVVTPYRYLLKSYPDEMLLKEMRDILREVMKEKKEEFLLAHCRKELMKVNVRDVVYIENAKRGSKAFLSKDSEDYDEERQILVEQKLSELQQEYECFVYTHNSFLVHINHIDKIDGANVFLDNGEMIPVSRRYYKDLKISFAKYIAGKY